MAESSIGVVRSPRILAMILVLLVLVAGITGNLFLASQERARAALFNDYASEVKTVSQELAKHAKSAAGGNAASFGALADARSRLETNLAYLSDGDAMNGLPGASGETASRVAELISTWEAIRVHVDLLLGNREGLAFLRDVQSDLAISMTAIQQENSSVVASLLRSGAAANQVALAQRQALLIERMARSLDRMLALGTAKNLTDNFNRDAANFRKVLEGQQNGDRELLLSPVTDASAVASLNKIEELFRSVSSRVNEVLTRSADVERVRGSADQIYVATGEVPLAVELVRRSRESSPGSIMASPLIAMGLGAISVILIIAIIVLVVRQASRSMAESGIEHEQNQAAILQLLDELADLADGDLTVQATVTESFTGAIADSINFSIDQMRALVSKINETSEQVSGAAAQTRNSMGTLRDASQRQASEIADVSESVNEMAVSIDKVSYNAAESFAVAERSVDIANNGASVVQNTINGMEQIRGQIQETAKRIKRLGESSQEIGDIVALINDIADQTNILSLNAAIQASMAGDAGKGFAVVADEVQRLAERSGAAAKQISALVKTIQSDTNEAVTSMEQTTAEVVQGTKLAEDAGVALGEIEGVSKSLAENIENISDAARQQAASAGRISNTMKSIQEITSQTTEGTRVTATAIASLAEMTDELRSSVTGFKLPE